jgi:LPXTG-site transpeptidase (sortase) family protein
MESMEYLEKDLKKRKLRAFFSAAFITFALIMLSFYMIGFVPYYVDGTSANVDNDFSNRVAGLSRYGFDNYNTVALANLPQLGEEETPVYRSVIEEETPAVIAEPERILINGVDIDLPVLNPESVDIGVLDNALLSGSVRYPHSARLGEDGNMFIFGHSSGLPVVKNQMFKAFNNIPELEKGDVITVIGGGMEYVYRVDNVRLTDVNEGLVDLSQKNGKKLTLSTCNSFGAKSERWVVEADFVGSYEAGV